MKRPPSTENGTLLEQTDPSTVASYLEVLGVCDYVTPEEDDAETWKQFASLIRRYKTEEEEE